jgi:alkyl hydroperoxide reductase subunit AhpC
LLLEVRAIGDMMLKSSSIGKIIRQRRNLMTLQINSIAPDFEAETTEGPIRFHDWIGDSWCIIFSHPKDFTPVCTTELGNMAKLKPEFDRRGVKIIGLSVDPVESHKKWSLDIGETQGYAPNYPMIGDPNLTVSKLYGMLPADAGESADGRSAGDNATVRTVFVIGPDKRVKLLLAYPMSTGRNFEESTGSLATTSSFLDPSRTKTPRSSIPKVGRRRGRTCASCGNQND